MIPEWTAVNEAYDTLSPKERIGQFFMPAAFINDTEEDVQAMEALIREHGIGGLCFFHSKASAATNYEGKKEVVYNEKSRQRLQELIERYQAASEIPLMIAIDAEWGLAMRVEETDQFPYALTLGAAKDKQLITQVGQTIARDLRKTGIHWNFAPVVDMNVQPENPVIGYRSFGEDAHAVTENARAFIKGMKAEGVLHAIKHFPGHGNTKVDSHLGLPVLEDDKETLLQTDLFPFVELIKEGVDAVMVGHLAVPALTGGKIEASSLSPGIIKGFLRGELGFEGVVVTDALNMHAISQEYDSPGELELAAFTAGNDVLCYCPNPVAGIEAIFENATEADIKTAFYRIWALKQKAFQEPKKSPQYLPEAVNLNSCLARSCITLYCGQPDGIAHFVKQGFGIVECGSGAQADSGVVVDSSSLIVPGKSFTDRIKDQFDMNEFKTATQTVDEIKEGLEGQENILLVLRPPQVKPQYQFGLNQDELKLIRELYAEKQLVIYHFGNPYMIRALGLYKTLATVMLYQDFPEFHEVAFKHFMGEVTAKGKLPVSLA
ncbi:MAG: glycoside hydrolase family 3 protein [Bacteroidia bacterium]|nr:glycoside hydrolase family 3 protein [Bacteroidia bacterium]